MWLGYWNDYPNYQTEGQTLDELKFMLCDVMNAIRDGDLVDTRVGRNTATMAFA